MFLIILLFCLNIVYGNPPQQKQEYRFGYSTNIYKEYSYSNNITTSFNSGRYGPNKVKGYDSHGNIIGDNSPETGTWIGSGQKFWQDGYDYYWDGTSWYRYKDGIYEKWMSTLGWHWQLFGSSTKPSGAKPGYQDNPMPIEEPGLLYILSIYTVFKRIKQRFRRKRAK